MTPVIHPENRDTLWQQGFVLFAILILLAAFCFHPVSAREIRIGLTELKPSLYTDEQGVPTGFFVDIIEDLAKKEGWEITWVSGTISASWDRLTLGEIDLLPAVPSTPERAEVYDFTNESALSIWSQVYARPDSGINTILDLDKKRVAMVKGASSGSALMDYARKFGINATYLVKDKPADILAAVASGEADAFVAYNSAGQEEIQEYGLVATPVMFNPAPFGFAVLKGKNQDLLRSLDRYLAEGKNTPSSLYSKAMEKWYGIKNRDIIPTFLWWILGGAFGLATLLVFLGFILRREVKRKTAEIAKQNEELQIEVANRTRAEMELVRTNEEIHAAYEQLAAMEKDVRESFNELQKSEHALMQAREKLHLLNVLTIRDIKNTFYILSGYIQISKDLNCDAEAKTYFDKEQEIIQLVQNSLTFAEKYQNLGITEPRWQNTLQVFLYAVSHLDLSSISRTVDLPHMEIFADPLFEDVFLALMETIVMQGAGVRHIGLRSQQNTDDITIFVESDGKGIPAEEKEQFFTWELLGKSGTSLFLAREILSITGIALQETGDPDMGIRFEITVPNGQYRMNESEE